MTPDRQSQIEATTQEKGEAQPRGWEVIELRNLAAEGRNTFVIGPFGSNLVKSDYRASGVPVIFVRDIVSRRYFYKSETYVTPEKAKELAAHTADPGDVLITKMGNPPGDATLYPEGYDRAVVTADVIRLRPARTKVTPVFLAFALNGDDFRHQVGEITGGQTRPKLTLRDYKRLQVSLPPLPEQRKIAAILSSVDETIEKTEAVIEQLGVVKKAMMQELLTRGLPGRHTRFKKTEIGEVPEAWEVVPLGDVLDGIDAGWSPKCESGPAAPNEWGVLKVSSVTWGRFNDQENKRLPSGLRPRPEIEVRRGDVIVSRANTPALVGRGVVVHRTRPLLMLSDKLLRLRVSERSSASFVNAVLASDFARSRIADGATGSSKSMKNISQEKLRGLPCPLPAQKEQETIVATLDGIDAHATAESDALEAARAVKSAIMSVLLTGEVRVTPDEAVQ